MARPLSRVFVDTSAVFALLDRDDPAGRLVRRVLDDASLTFVTHVLVVVELVTLVTRRLGFEAAERVIDEVLPRLEVVMVDDELLAEGLTAFRASGTGRVSLVDRTSFAFMRREGLDTAIALDEDFRAAGFEVLPAARG